MAIERVQKILAKAGIASRRKAEEMIQEGLVTINGKVAQIGDKADLNEDSIKVAGKLLQGAEAPVYMAFYKPKGVISMLADPEGRATLKDFLTKVKTRVYPIGRLDFNSEGLIILTNDGEFTEALQKRDDIARVYHIKVKGHPEASRLNDLGRGAKVGEKTIKPHSVRLVEELDAKSKIEVVILGSGAVDVKGLCETKGFLVEKVVRTAIGHLTLKGLAPGEFRYLKPSQAKSILDQPELGMRKIAEDAARGPTPREAAEDQDGFEDEDYSRPNRGPKGGRSPRFGASKKFSDSGAPKRVVFGRGAADLDPAAKSETSGIRVRRRGAAPATGGARSKDLPRDDRGGFSDRKPRFGAGRPPRRDDDREGGFSERKPRFGAGRPPRRDRDEDQGGSFERQGDVFKPRFSRDSERSGGGGFGRDRGERPARKPFGSKPSFGGGRDSSFDRGERSDRGGEKPRFGGGAKRTGGGLGGSRGGKSFGGPRGGAGGGKGGFKRGPRR